MSVKTFTKAQLAELSKKPNSVVYQYASPDPLAEPIPLDIVEKQVLDCWARLQELRETDAQFEDIKKKVDAEFATLEETHPMLYSRIVNRESTQAHFDALMFVIKVKKEDPSDAGRAKVAQRLKEQFPMFK